MIKIITLLKKYGLFIIIAIFVFIPMVLKWLKKKPTDQTAVASDVLDKLGCPDEHKPFFNKRALDVAHNLGTAYPSWDPRYWTENDEIVYNLLKDMNEYDIEKISLLYFEVYAKGRTLSADLAKLLDSKYYEKLDI